MGGGGGGMGSQIGNMMQGAAKAGGPFGGGLAQGSGNGLHGLIGRYSGGPPQQQDPMEPEPLQQQGLGGMFQGAGGAGFNPYGGGPQRGPGAMGRNFFGGGMGGHQGMGLNRQMWQTTQGGGAPAAGATGSPDFMSQLQGMMGGGGVGPKRRNMGGKAKNKRINKGRKGKRKQKGL